MKPAGYEFQSDFARHHFARGQAQGRAALVVKLLTRRFGLLTQQVEARIAEASIAQLDEIGERLLTAQTLFAEGRRWGCDGRLAVHATATLAAK